MTSPAPYTAADRRSGEGDYTAPRSGYERPRKSARFSEHRERDYFRAICAGEGFAVRATGIVGNETETRNPKARLPARYSSSALPLSAECVGRLRGILLPLLAFRRCKFSRRFEAPGSLFHSLRIAINLRQKSFRGRTQAFQDHSLSAASRGLVALGDGHTIGERKQVCPNQDGTNPYRNGVSAK